MPELRGKITIEIAQAIEAVGRLKQAVQGIKTQALKLSIDSKGVEQEAKIAGEKAGSQFQSGFRTVGLGTLSTMMGNLFTQAVNSVKNFASSILEASANLEQMQVSFQVLVGDVERANELFAQIKSYSAVTPYESEDLAKAAQTMLGFGIAADEVMNNLRAIGDIAMGNKEKLGALSLAFSQVMSTGRLMGQDLLQMINAGFNPLKVISEKTGISIGELKKKMEQGAISAKMVQEAFKAATQEGGQFYKMSEKQSATFAGVMSTLKDNVKSFGVAIAKDVFESLKSFLNEAVSFINKLREAFQKEGLRGVLQTIFPPTLGAVIYTMLRNIVTTVQALAKILWELKPVIGVIVTFGGIWFGVAKGIQMVTTAVTFLRGAMIALNATVAANPYMLAFTALATIAVVIISNWEKVKKFFEGLIGWLKKGIDSIVKALKDAWNWFKGLLGLQEEVTEEQAKMAKKLEETTKERRAEVLFDPGPKLTDEQAKKIADQLREQQEKRKEIRKEFEKGVETQKQGVEEIQKKEEEHFEWKFEQQKQDTERLKREAEKRKQVLEDYFQWQSERQKEITSTIWERQKTIVIEELESRKAILEERLNELQVGEKTQENFERQRAIIQEITELEKQRLAIVEEIQKAKLKETYEKEIRDVEEKYKEVLKVVKKGSKEEQEVQSTHQKQLAMLKLKYEQEVLAVEEKTKLERERITKSFYRRIQELEQEQAQQQLNLIEEQRRSILQAVSEFQSALSQQFSSVGRRMVDRSEIDRQIEELDQAYIRASISEQEYTRRRKELAEQRTKAVDVETLRFQDAYTKTFDAIVEKLSQTDPLFIKLNESLELFLENLQNLSASFVEALQNSAEGGQSFSEYFNRLVEEISAGFQAMANVVSAQTGLMASKLIAEGIPAIEAFKKAFLLSILDMAEKIVITQIPAISAMIQSVIPFPASIPVVASVIASITALLELAKAKIRGAEQGYLAGFREGRPGVKDTMLIYINPKEAILPEWAVEKNREAIKLMLQGISFDRQLKAPSVVYQPKEVKPFIPSQLKIKFSSEVAFQPIRFRGADVLIRAEQYRARFERLRR